MGINEIRKLKEAAGQPKVRKAYVIPKISEKRKKSLADEKALFEADKAFYKEIWDASPHKCGQCGCSLGKELKTLHFHHLLGKAKYPQFRHTPENVMILCWLDHMQAEMDLDKVPKVKARTLEARKLLLGE